MNIIQSFLLSPNGFALSLIYISIGCLVLIINICSIVDKNDSNLFDTFYLAIIFKYLFKRLSAFSLVGKILDILLFLLFLPMWILFSILYSILLLIYLIVVLVGMTSYAIFKKIVYKR